MARWNRLYDGITTPVRLDSGAVLVTDAQQIRSVLKDKEHFVDESAFLRTSTFFPLPESQRFHLVKSFIELMQPDIPHLERLLEKRFARSSNFRLQADGTWLMYHLYENRIHASQRNSRISELVKYYVARKTIHDDIQGGLRRLQGKSRAQLDTKLGRILATENPIYPDLVSVVLASKLEMPEMERSELYLRLVQSLVAFTGTALETSLYFLARNSGWKPWIRSREHAHAFVLETLRCFPTAWRLTRTVSINHHLDTFPLIENDELILAISVPQVKASLWGQYPGFDPHRWMNENGTNGLYLFGLGKGSCPGKKIALTTITQCFWRIVRSYSISVVRDRTANPYVRSILASPRVNLKIEPGLK